MPIARLPRPSRWSPWLLLAALCGCGERPPETPPPPPARTADREPPPDSPAALLDRLGYVEFAAERVGAGEASGLILERPEARPRALLVSVVPEARWELRDSDGSVLHRWTLDAQWAVDGRILPDGDLLAVTFLPCALWRLGPQGEVRWCLDRWVHHQVEVLENGDLLALRADKLKPPPPRIASEGREHGILDEKVCRISADGEILEEHSLLAAILEAPGLVRFDSSQADALHTNSVDWIDRPDLPADHPFGGGPKVLVSVRNQNVLVALDWATGELVWSFGQDELIRQHDASLTREGTVIVFDNGDSDRPFSRIVEIDPGTDRIVWTYTAPEPAAFFSEARGTVQELEGDRLLVGSSNAGEAFEIDREGSVSWRFLLPASGTENRRPACRVYGYRTEDLPAVLRARPPTPPSENGPARR